MATRAKPKAGQNRVGMMVRIAPDIRERLEKAAEKAGRSLGQEVELRLDRSFELVSMFEMVAKTSAELAVKMTAESMDKIEQHTVDLAGGGDMFMAWARLSYLVQSVEAETGKSIRDDDFTKNKAEREVIGYIPTIFRNLPDTYRQFKERSRKSLGEGTLPSALLALGKGLGEFPPLGHTGPWPPTE